MLAIHKNPGSSASMTGVLPGLVMFSVGSLRLTDNPALLKGLNVAQGKVTYEGVAEAFGMEYHAPAQFLG